MAYKTDGESLTFELADKITSGNAHLVEDEINSALDRTGATKLTLDANDLEYISSAGLRIIVRVLKRGVSVTVANASPEVCNVLQVTGIDAMVDVQKKLRQLSTDGLQQIGAGANGRVYRLNDEQILKVYNPLTNPPEKIMREKETARQAFVLGIPSALSFDMVLVGDGYGIVYELVDALTLGETIAKNPDRADEYATRMARLLRQLHATEFEEGSLPDGRLGLHAWVDVAQNSGYYTDDLIEKARALIDSIPPRNTFVHGDFHPGNIMVTGEDELILIDMGDAAVGDPLIDLLGSYQLMCLVGKRPGAAELYTRMPGDLLSRVWDVFVREYYDEQAGQAIEAIERKLRFYAILRGLAGVTFSEVLSEDQRQVAIEQISAAFLSGYAAFERSNN